MTLRARLTLFFIGIVVLPLLAATLVYQMLHDRQAEARTNTRLDGAARAVSALWEERLRLVQREVGIAAERLAPTIGEPTLQQDVDEVRPQVGLDFLMVSDSAGGLLAVAQDTPDYLDGVTPAAPEEIAATEEPRGVLVARVDVVEGERVVVITGGRFTDQVMASELSAAAGLPVALVDGGRVVASTRTPAPTVPEGGEGELPSGDRALLVAAGAPGGGVLLLAPVDRTSPLAFWLIAAAGLLAATVFGSALARVIARPLERLADGARRVAGGDLETRVPVDTAGDVARVAEAFNTMTGNLRTYIGELQGSRDELRRNLDRLGTTLRNTLDLEGMLEVVLDTAAVTLGAESGALFLMAPDSREIRLEAAAGFDPPKGVTLAAGQGIAGRAVAGRVLVPGEPPVQPVPPEPEAFTAAAVPLVRRDRTIGVIALYGRTTPQPFREEDVDTLLSFATQASVAIENVLLYQETQQLSITDGLTGAWNRRYLELTLRKEIDRASRFGRTLSVLMIDIDRFKLVNDRHGHRRGDEVLIELTRRLMHTIRVQIDFVARYGGEEFLVVLPETPCEGAKVVAEKVRRAIRDEAFGGEGAPVELTVSVGVASYPLDGTTAQDLIQAADLALYEAKRGGRDRVETASPA